MYYVGSICAVETDVKHYGIQGMKWGQRRYQNPDGTLTEEGKERYRRKVSKEAKKDVKRYADAKMYYGEGAGTRRKLLKAELDKKKKNDPVYAEEFERHLAEADYARSASRAKTERTVRDTATNAKRITKKIIKFAAPIAITAAGIYYAYNKDKIDSAVNRAIDDAIHKVRR